MNVRKSHHRDLSNERRLKTIEQHKSQQDQTLDRIISTSPIKFVLNKALTQSVEAKEQLAHLQKNTPLFQNLKDNTELFPISSSKISHHRRNKTEMTAVDKNKRKDPVFNALFVPFLQTKTFDFGKSLNSHQKSKSQRVKAKSNPNSQAFSVSDNFRTQNQNRYSHRQKKISLPGISKLQGARSLTQVKEYKKSTQSISINKSTLNFESKKSLQKVNQTASTKFNTTGIGKTKNRSIQRGQSFRLPIEAKNVRDFKAKDRQNKLNSRRNNPKEKKEKQWKEVNYLQLKTCYYQIDKKIASNSTIQINPMYKNQENKTHNTELKGLKKELLLHERAPKTPQFPQVIEQVSLLIKNFHSMRKKKVSIDKLIKSKEFAVKFVQKQFLYFGQLKNQKFHGYGILVKPGYVFEGQWRDGEKVQGAESKKGVFFEGQFVQNKKIGFGISYWNNGYDEYSGEWKDGLKNGNGVWKNLDGDQYIGQWVNGKVQGFGVHTTGDGQKYQGFFTNFLKSGKGKESFQNGDEYEGNFLKGKPSGYGVYKFYRSQAVYEGNFQKGLRHGQGKFIVPNLFEYSGEFDMDNVSGYGKVIYSNNDCYIGNFKQGVKHGKGSFHKIKERVILNGFWKNGQFFEKE